MAVFFTVFRGGGGARLTANPDGCETELVGDPLARRISSSCWRRASRSGDILREVAAKTGHDIGHDGRKESLQLVVGPNYKKKKDKFLPPLRLNNWETTGMSE